MIQKTSARLGNTSVAPIRAPTTTTTTTGPEQWGSWSNHRHYTLEVVQNPVRARMCGFGDKDRRPLAPAAVCKMIVKREDHSIVSEDDIDVSFFLVTVDLWSEDGAQEMNLVLHPSSQDRVMNSYLPQPKARRRGGSVVSASTSRQHQQMSPETAHSTPATSATTVTAPHYSQLQQSSPLTTIIPPQAPQFNTQGYTFQQPSTTTTTTTTPEQITFHNTSPYGTPPTDTGTHPTWYQPAQASLSYDRTSSSVAGAAGGFSQNVHAVARAGSGGAGQAPSGSSAIEQWQDEGGANISESAYRGWPQSESGYPTMDDAPAAPHMIVPNDSSIRSSLPRQNSSWSQSSTFSVADAPAHNKFGQDSFPASAPQPQFDDTVYASPPYTQQQQHQQQQPTHTSYYPNSTYINSPPPVPPPSAPANPPNRQSFTRTLVGPLSANACRLNDEHRKPGIFFLFQDLSVRTEGTFRLRLRLMNVGGPENGPPRTHTGESPVLAQTFTDPFMVYSAKRFPGVPDTTALSISFGSQGQKLPLRNRHGKSRKRPRGGETDGSDEDDEL